MTLSLESFMNRITPKDRGFFIRQLSMLVQSGVPLSQGLTLVSQQTTNEGLRHAIRVMTADVQNGHPFSVAIARYPQLFDQVMVAMLKSGEASGQLNIVLAQMADQMDKQMAFTSKVRNALLYPAFVIFVMIIVGVIMTTVIIPKLQPVFEDAEYQLPWITSVVLGISNFMMNYWYVLLIVLILGGIALRSLLAGPGGREVIYRIQKRIPVVNTLVVNSYLVRFTTVLSMLLKAGIPITEALTIVSDSLSNPVWSGALKVVRQEVERGVPLSVALARHPMYPKPLTEMISVGEQTGQIDATLTNMGNFYEQQTDSAIKALTALLEPIILMIVAVGVGVLVVSVILPIYGLAEQF